MLPRKVLGLSSQREEQLNSAVLQVHKRPKIFRILRKEIPRRMGGELMAMAAQGSCVVAVLTRASGTAADGGVSLLAPSTDVVQNGKECSISSLHHM